MMTVRLNLTELPRPPVSFTYGAPSRSGTQPEGIRDGEPESCTTTHDFRGHHFYCSSDAAEPCRTHERLGLCRVAPHAGLCHRGWRDTPHRARSMDFTAR